MDPLGQRVPDPSISQRCHTDALHCIFGCLGAAVWLAALLPCRGWLSIGLGQLQRSFRFTVQPDRIAPLCTSSLRHHVAAVQCVDLRLDQLQRTREMPRMTALDATRDYADLTDWLRSA